MSLPEHSEPHPSPDRMGDCDDFTGLDPSGSHPCLAPSPASILTSKPMTTGKTFTIASSHMLVTPSARSCPRTYFAQLGEKLRLAEIPGRASRLTLPDVTVLKRDRPALGANVSGEQGIQGRSPRTGERTTAKRFHGGPRRLDRDPSRIETESDRVHRGSLPDEQGGCGIRGVSVEAAKVDPPEDPPRRDRPSPARRSPADGAATAAGRLFTPWSPARRNAPNPTSTPGRSATRSPRSRSRWPRRIRT